MPHHSRKPVIPQRAVLSGASFSGYAPRPRSILDAGDVKFVTSGRMGIALALRALGVGAGDKVLVPAYHCSSMVEPVVWAGAEPVFYRINPNTSVDMDDLEAKIDGARVLMVTHYFGFLQCLETLRECCDRHGVALIEDCAHAFFGKRAGRPVGWWGDYAVASVMKFFPVYDGGCLVSSRHDLSTVDTVAAGWKFQVKSALNTLEHAFEYRRLGLLARLMALPMRLKDRIWQSVKQHDGGGGARPVGPASADGGYEFDADWVNKRMSMASRVLLRLVSKARVAERRCANYRRMADAFRTVPGCTLLFPELPETVVPYVFPLLVDEPERLFPLVRAAGIPVLRFGEFLWEGVDAKTCPVSADLSRRLFQFPCHQELKEHELQWLIEAIVSVLGGRALPVAPPDPILVEA